MGEHGKNNFSHGNMDREAPENLVELEK